MPGPEPRRPSWVAPLTLSAPSGAGFRYSTVATHLFFPRCALCSLHLCSACTRSRACLCAASAVPGCRVSA